MVVQLGGANIPFGRVKNGCKAFPPLLCMFITVAMNRREHSSHRVILVVWQPSSLLHLLDMNAPYTLTLSSITDDASRVMGKRRPRAATGGKERDVPTQPPESRGSFAQSDTG